MRETLASLDSQMRSLLSETDPTFFDETAAKDYFNAAQDQVSRDAPFVLQTTFRTKTVPSSTLYALPEEVLEPTGCFLQDASGNPYRVTWCPPAELDGALWRRGSSSHAYAATYRVVEEGMAVELLPSPSTRYNLFVNAWVRPRPMTVAESECDYPPWATSLLVKCAYWQCKLADEEVAQARDARAIYERELADVRKVRGRKQADQHNRVMFGMRFGPLRGRWAG